VDSRLRRSPPDRASGPYGQAVENATRFSHLAHRSAAAHKLHSTPLKDRMNLISGKGETSSRLPAVSLFLPEPVQTPGAVAAPTDRGGTSAPGRIHQRYLSFATDTNSVVEAPLDGHAAIESLRRRCSTTLKMAIRFTM
jgi:hypothetical protein